MNRLGIENKSWHGNTWPGVSFLCRYSCSPWLCTNPFCSPGFYLRFWLGNHNPNVQVSQHNSGLVVSIQLGDDFFSPLEKKEGYCPQNKYKIKRKIKQTKNLKETCLKELFLWMLLDTEHLNKNISSILGQRYNDKTRMLWKRKLKTYGNK